MVDHPLSGGIIVKFERVPVTATYTFENVVNVTWAHSYATQTLVDQTSEIGHKITTFTVSGFLRVLGDIRSNTAQQQALETALHNVGTGTLTYTGTTDTPNVRFTGLDFKEYRGATIAQFTATFVTEFANVHAHNPITLGAQALTIANGFELPKITDSITAQAIDEQVSDLTSRKFSIQGRMVGATIAEVNAAHDLLVAAVQNKNSVVLEVSSGNGGFSRTVRTVSLTFGVPELREQGTARTYAYECVTHDDYTKEPYTLGHSPMQFGHVNLTVDIVDKIDHTFSGDKEGVTYTAITEALTVSAKKYFADWDAYNTYVQLFNPFPYGTYFYSAPNTYQTLELRSIDIGALSRDGNFPSTAKRYSASITLSFEWLKSISETSQVYATTMLGALWYRVISTTHGVTVNELGDITSRSVSLSGQMFDSDLTVLKGKVGSPQTLGDSSISTKQYYINSISINKTDKHTVLPSTPVIIHDISVSASQLDTASERSFFLARLFQKDAGHNIIFDKVTSQSKSLSNRWKTIGASGKFVCVSMNLSLSGEIWIADANGKPNPGDQFRAFQFFNLFDATQEATLSSASPPTASYPASTYNGNDFLPIDPYSFFITSISIGEWTPAISPENHASGAKGTPHWRQTISVSATAVFDLAGGGSSSGPDWVDTTSYIINDQTTKFTQLRVMGQGTVFKATGIEPSTAQTTIQRAYKDKATLDADKGNALSTPGFPPGWPFTGAGDSEPTKDTEETRGTTRRRVMAWKATKEK